ncbi:hypothetical protein COV19_04610 [Candidatus Woesearchaeota archaeon CG10_big_fil_rev_8_21_14_0_10_44_13]|nr:MAG: hypothetical protein COV19_04610 [Candidatus Woesearchaeota archaeon CG10_big_fil_rev_8_21_14_0_10_44_13]
MKRLFVLLAVLSLLLAGCSGKDDQQVISGNGAGGTGTGASGSTATQGSGTQTTQPQGLMVTTLSAQEQKLAEDKMKTGERVAVSTSMKYLNVGDVYTFGVGIKNGNPTTNNFRLKPNLDDAKSPGISNLIHTDATIDNWLARNRFDTIQLKAGESRVVPLIIEVGPEISTSSKTVPGSYTFEVLVEYESSPRFWDRYNDDGDLLTIKIK